MKQPLTDRVAIVTGAGTGIGRAAALSLARAGVRVALVGRREEPLGDVADEIERAEGKVVFQPTDVAVREQVDALVKLALDHWGRVDVLVNNAGTNVAKRSLAETTQEDWDRLIAVNLTGVFNCAQAVLPIMRAQADALIINVSSLAGKRASALAGAAYSAAKHGVVALTQSINAEEHQNGIRSSVICPGEVDTPILELRGVPVPAERRAQALRPEDCADLIHFLASMPRNVLVPEVVIAPSGLKPNLSTDEQ